MSTRKLPFKNRRVLQETHNVDDANRFSAEVKTSFSRFPQLCNKMSTAEGCKNCEWRLKRLNFTLETSRSAEIGSDIKLHDYHDEGHDGLKVVEDEAPVCDMLKVRGLFDLMAAPPRRARVTKDSTLKNLAGVAAPLDRRRFTSAQFSLLSDHQVKNLTEHIFELTAGNHTTALEFARAKCTLRNFETAVARSGLCDRLSKARTLRAFERLVEMDRIGQKHAQKLAIASNMGGSTHALAAKAFRKSSCRMSRGSELSIKEMRRSSLNFDWFDDEENEETDFREVAAPQLFKEPGFRLSAWSRATQHAAVIVDSQIEAGDDVEWSLVINDLLDFDWPWDPTAGTDAEECIDDEKGKNFKGLFIGITHRPVAMGPKIQDSSLAGFRARDGAILQAGRMLTLEETRGTTQFHGIESNEHEPVIVHLRLDRRPVDHHQFASRLWVYCEGIESQPATAQVLVDDLNLDRSKTYYPVVYASYPVHDICHCVKIRDKPGDMRSCQDTCAGPMHFADDSIGQPYSFLHSDVIEERLRLARAAPRSYSGRVSRAGSEGSPARSGISSPSTPYRKS